MLTDRESRHEIRQSTLGLFACVLLVFGVAVGVHPFRELMGNILGVPHDGPHNDGGLLTILRYELVTGACASAALVLSGVLIAFTWTRYRTASINAAGLAWISFGIFSGTCWAILWRCSNVMGTHPKLAWVTFEEYIGDPLVHHAPILAILPSVPLVVVLWWWFGESKRRHGQR